MKITKEIRKEIKFALKRGDKIEQVRKMLLELGGETGHKKLIKVWSLPYFGLIEVLWVEDW